jgi:hypothetical protein
MHRREVLGIIGTGVATGMAGCVGQIGALVGLGGRAVIERVDTDPQPDLPVSPTVSVGTRRASAEQPATLSVGWANTSARVLGLGEADEVVCAQERSADGAVVLFSPEAATNRSEFRGCWQATVDRIGGPAVYGSVRLKPGGTHEGLAGLYSWSGCHAEGAYRFLTRPAIDPNGDGPSRQGEWGFDVEISVG